MPGSIGDAICDEVISRKVEKTTESQKIDPMSDYTVQVDNYVYNTAALADVHPGGELFVKAFSGRDATEAFLSYHRREFPHHKMSEALVGKREANKPAHADKEYLELCKIVDQVLPKHKAFAPVSYYLKVAAILSTAIGLECYMHYTGNYKWYLSAFLGWAMALIGLNIQHDANHGAISRYPLVNRLLGLSQNWIGGSALDWIHQHVVQHHIHCNDVNNDPDIVGNDLLRFNPLKPMAKHHVFQHIYMFLLLSFFGFTYIIDSAVHVINGFHFIKMSKLVKSNRAFELGTIAFYAFRWLILPQLRNPSIYTFLNIVPMFIVGGYYLSFFFVISHNFEGVHMFEKADSAYEHNFLRKQVATSSNVGGAWLCFINGGLNYQIEHHLFPRISHTHYPKIAPIVREFCESRKIPYVHFPTIAENVASCSRHMLQLGTTSKPVHYHGQ